MKLVREIITKNTIKKGFFVLLSIFGAFVFMESIVHFTDRSAYDSFLYDEESGLLLHKPNTSKNISISCLSNNAHFNSLGFYGLEVKPKEPDEYRIMVTGGSLAESLQVPLNERYDYLLQKKLNESYPGKKYSVVAVGFAGNGTFLNMLYFKKYVKAVDPDIIINLITNYDFGRDGPDVNHPPFFNEKGEVVTQLPLEKRNPTRLFVQGLMRESKLTMNLYYKYMAAADVLGRKSGAEKKAGEEEVENTYFRGDWKVEEKLVDKFKEMAKNNGVRFLLMSWTQDAIHDRLFMKKNLTPIMKKNKTDYFDITENLDKIQNSAGQLTWTCDGHWNKLGHISVADSMFDFLKTRPDLLK